MSRLVIDNIGPINHIDIPINRLNVIIGKQSSGKSTIAKVLSFCLWLEKDIIAHQEKEYVDENFMIKELLNYHKITNYIREGTYIHYDGDFITFDYHSPIEFNITLSDSFNKAENGKVAYIPSERNIVAMTNISSLQMDKSYVRDFLFNWLSIHSIYTKADAMPIIDLGVKYYYDEDSKIDKVVLPDGKELGIDEVSSGIQSIIPLYVYMNYVTKWVFKHEESTSYDKYAVIQKALIREVMKDVDEDTVNEALSIPTLQEQLKNSLSIIRRAAKVNLQSEELTPVTDLMEKLEKPHFANLIIEEPELNLFPQTQVSLVYAMLKEIDLSRDKVMITTHSPYTLYAINNCMLSHKVGDDMDNDDKLRLPSFASRIDSDMVSVWQTNDNGTLTDIKTSPLGLIGKHYFNEIMNDTLDEYHTMLDYTE